MKTSKLIVVGLFAAFFIYAVFGNAFTDAVSGQSGLTAPTRVIASDGSYVTKVGINWDAVRGAANYQIFRNTVNDTSSATSVGTTAAPYFFDQTAVAGQQYFYWVIAKNGAVASDFGQPDTGLRANGQVTGPILGPPPPPPFENPMSASKATLGKILFWDEQMSSTGTVSCGTCHRPAAGGSDPRTLVGNPASANPGFDGIFNTPDDVAGSPGVPLNDAGGLYNWSNTYGMRAQVTSRKSPSFIDAVYAPFLFWDGRANGTFRDPVTNAVISNAGAALESQAVNPPVSDSEMGHTGTNWLEVAQQVSAARPLALSPNIPTSLQAWIGGRGYPALFEEVFGTPEVTPVRISMAIATYERTLFSDRTPLDMANSGIAPLTAENSAASIFSPVMIAVSVMPTNGSPTTASTT